MQSALLLTCISGCHQKTDPRREDDDIRAVARSQADHRELHQIKLDNALIDAAFAANSDRVRKYLADGANVNGRYIDPRSEFVCQGLTGYTALMRACQAGNAMAVRDLLKAHPDLTLEFKGRTALYFAAVGGHKEIITLLLESGAKGDPKEFRLTYELCQAACAGFKPVDGEGYPPSPGVIGNPLESPNLESVLKEGAKVNAFDANGYTALMYAANLGLLENVKVLIENGADPALVSKDGYTALMLARRPGASTAVRGRNLVAEYLERLK